MLTYKHVCDVCGHNQEVYSYGDFACSSCGQEYKYDEGHKIALSPEQIAALRTMNEERD